MATITQYNNSNIVITHDNGTEQMLPSGVVPQKKGTDIHFLNSNFVSVASYEASEITEVTDRNGTTTPINNADTLFYALRDNFHFRTTEPAPAAVVQQSVITFTNRSFLSGNNIPILSAPGENMFYDVISISMAKNLTTGYTRGFGTFGFIFTIGAQQITSAHDGIQIESAGIRAEKIPILGYSGDDVQSFSSVINRTINVRNASLTGGVGTIKIYLNYTTGAI